MTQSNEALIMQLGLFEKQIEQVQEQLEAVSRGIIELQTLSNHLPELSLQKDAPIFAPVGHGIYIPATITGTELLVDIGDRRFVSKSIPETQKLIAEQLVKLHEAQESLGKTLEEINQALGKTFAEHTAAQK